MQKLTPADKALISKAQKLIQKRQSEITAVGCALETTSGQIFTGVNFESLHSSPCSTCAEYTAIGQMHTKAEHKIASIVAVMANGTILPPCGRCREMIRQFGDAWVILPKGKMRISELIPEWK